MCPGRSVAVDQRARFEPYFNKRTQNANSGAASDFMA
jgi:hypothetical protein